MSLIFGKYEVVGQLAKGGMGEVFLARQTIAGHERKVILKSLLDELAEEEGFVEQFLDEARVTAALNHPNIVSIFEVGAWQGVYYIALEYIGGVDLARLRNHLTTHDQRLPIPVLAKIMHDAALGLNHAHTAVGPTGQPLNVIHRDVSPQNIMVRSDGVVKIVDFGVAKSRGQMTKTQTGMLKGKLQYMPPEQVRGDVLDARADQFALATCFWELATGERLFRGNNEVETLQFVLSRPIPRPSKFIPDFPPDLEATLMQMLARDRNKRFATCGDAARSIATYLDHVPGRVDERAVAAAVAEPIAKREAMRVPAPASPDDFVVSLDGGANEDHHFSNSPATGTNARRLATEAEGLFNPQGSKVIPIAAAAGLALALLVGGGLFVLGAEERETPAALATLPLPDGSPPEEPAPVEPVTPAAAAADAPPATAEPTPTRKPPKRRKARKNTRPSEDGQRAPPLVSGSALGYVTLNATPWAQVFVDGRPMGSTPIYKLPLKTGPHKIRFENPALGKEETRRLVVKPDGQHKLIVALE